MTSLSLDLLQAGRLRVAALAELARRPALFAPGEKLFWNHPHISAQMLQAHLHPQVDAASHPPQVIERSISWIAAQLQLEGRGRCPRPRLWAWALLRALQPPWPPGHRR